MASLSTQFQHTIEKGLLTLYAIFKVGAAGAPTLQSFTPKPDGSMSLASAPALGWHGVTSVARTAAGAYTITLDDKHLRLVRASQSTALSGGIPAAKVMAVDSSVGDLTSSAAGSKFGIVFSAPVNRNLVGTAADASGGAQSVTLTGSKVGDKVISVFDATDLTDVSADFETSITIADHIQQTSTNLATKKILVFLEQDTATDPDNGAVVALEIVVQNSGAV